MKKIRLKKLVHAVTYMQVSLLLFILSLIISLALGIRAVTSGGNLEAWEGLLGIVALIFSVLGFITPLYGRFTVHAQTRLDYRIGLVLNGILMLILFFFYFLGL